MNKTAHHFYFRFKQFFRVGNLEAKVGMAFAIIALVVICAKLPKDFYYPVAFSLPILSLHFSRKDLPFLQKIFINNWRIIILAEYAVIYFLCVFANINYQFEKFTLLPVIAFAALVFIKPNERKTNFKLNFIPDFYFEWKSYFRRYFWLSVLVYVLAVASAYHQSTLILGALFFSEFIAYVFQPNENKEMLEMYFSKFSLKEKIVRNLKFFNLLLMPVSLLFLILNSAQFYYWLFYIDFFNVFFLLVITRKYKIYSHKKSKSYFDMGTALEFSFLSITIIPGIFVIKNNFKAAKKNISNYVGY